MYLQKSAVPAPGNQHVRRQAFGLRFQEGLLLRPHLELLTA